MRKIIHIDMDAFYASVEQRDFPEYRGVPLVVGGPPNSRGVVATASYEARKYGVRSAMPCSQAARLCPHAVFVPPRFDAYKAVSAKIREIFRRYTDVIEPLSLDEAYLDVTTDKRAIGSAMEIARQIKAAIRSELGLTASAGISVNKFVAKIASDMQKPDGLTFIGPSRIERFMENLPVEKFFGVGKVTAAKMKQMQLFTGADLKRLSEVELVRLFGKSGRFYYHIVRGVDDRPVQPDRELKSIAVEDTFGEDLHRVAAMEEELEKIATKLAGRMQSRKLKGRTITLKIRFADFRLITRSHSLPYYTDAGEEILSAARNSLQLVMAPEPIAVRLLGISVSNFDRINLASNQLSLF
ncbi:DNA polymerase IV [Parapedobacter indicus]|uniref:DNA polymerase IV n=1 Tax=Parapedobacter indicus TaxID=1477437 RepID=A0A1I3CRJ4_9SPHI|nr:DNA polymerase IV [Parapedobacter indicus]PPL04359.1 DNA polymerase-4 [Parapedobacter indicus]SFH76891.1 DNA polymerase-4 [Parapedobacter indicus]